MMINIFKEITAIGESKLERLIPRPKVVIRQLSDWGVFAAQDRKFAYNPLCFSLYCSTMISLRKNAYFSLQFFGGDEGCCCYYALKICIVRLESLF